MVILIACGLHNFRINQKTGKFKLSRKALLPKPEGYEEHPPRPERGDRGPRREYRD